MQIQRMRIDDDDEGNNFSSTIVCLLYPSCPTTNLTTKFIISPIFRKDKQVNQEHTNLQTPDQPPRLIRDH